MPTTGRPAGSSLVNLAGPSKLGANLSSSSMHRRASANIALGEAPNGAATTIETAGQQPAADELGSPEVNLKRTLNVWSGCSVILGVMIGSGIFVSPQGVLIEAGSIGASLTVWTLCGLLCLLGALCFAELGTSIKTSGGEYTYIKLAYGPLASFLYLWVLVLIILPCSNAITALTFAKYCLQPFYLPAAVASAEATQCDSSMAADPPENAVRLLALAIILLLAYINCASVSGSVQVQNTFTMAKVASLVLIISYGLYYIFTGRAESLASMDSIWSGTQTSLPHLAKAFYASYYTYSGWNSLNCLTEEMKNPVRNMPRSIILSITLITVIYVLTNVAYFAILTRAEILNSDAIVAVFGNKALSFARWLMPLLVAGSTMGGLNSSIFSSSRILFAGARTGQLFSALQMIHLEYMTPIPALIFLASVSVVYLFTTKILVLINYMTFIEASFAALGVSTVLRLRYKLPDLERPIKIPWPIPILYLTFSLLLILLPVLTSPMEAIVGLAILLAGIPIYYATVAWKVKPKRYQSLIDGFNSLAQKITKSVPPSSSADLIM